MRTFEVELRDDAVPSFLWDEPTTLAELRRLLAEGSEEQRYYYAAKVMREARFDHVWTLVPLATVLDRWDHLHPRLGRRRALWEHLIDEWTRQDLISDPRARSN